MKHTLYLVRGLPGAGKSTFAFTFSNSMRYVFEADQYFINENGIYEFDASKLTAAHAWCQEKVRHELASGFDCIVSNTSTTEREVEIYAKIAEDYNANFVSLIIENRHGSKSVHNVPDTSIEKMRQRFSIKL